MYFTAKNLFKRGVSKVNDVCNDTYKNTDNEVEKELETFAKDYGLTIREAKEVIFAFHMSEFKAALDF